MTKNQIEYLKHKENQRSNLVQEDLTRARDRATRELGFANLAELGRHNVETERNATFVSHEQMRHNMEQEAIAKLGQDIQRQELSLKRESLAETVRHNQQNELLTSYQLEHQKSVLSEQQRHSMVLESQQATQISEAQRHNLVSERELQRHNMASEAIGQSQLSLGRDQLAETKRSNLAREVETSRHNTVSEGLTSQQIAVSQSQVGLGYAQLDLGYHQLGEQIRSHLASEAELNRSNLARESEATRSNMAREAETYRANLARETETHRANVVSERQTNTRNRETKRHNYTLEELERVRNSQGWVTSVSGAVTAGSKIIPIIGGFVS